MNQDRIKGLSKLMKSNDVKATLIIPSEDLRMISGHSPLLCERFQGLFVRDDGEYFYFCSPITKSEAIKMVGDNRVYTWHDNNGMTSELEKVLREYKLLGQTIAVSKNARAFNILNIAQALDVVFTSGKSMMESITLIKSENEMQLLRKAADITDEVIEEVIMKIKRGMSEGQIAGMVEEGFLCRGAIPNFAIVACGKNTSLPHYTGQNGVIQENDLVLLDIGCKYNGLSSDMTRTVFVGEPSEKMRKVYELVLTANLAGETACVLGNAVDKIDKEGRAVIESAGYGEFFMTRIGHGIGYSTHEAPYIKQNSGQILECGMAFSVEPGIYIEGEFGVRIEDIVIMTDGGPEIINKFNKNLMII